MMKLMMRLMNLVLPTCEEVSRLASRAMDEDLPWRARLGFRVHLMACIWCRRNAGQLETMRDLVRCAGHADSGDEPRLSSAARERITLALSQDDHELPDA